MDKGSVVTISNLNIINGRAIKRVLGNGDSIQTGGGIYNEGNLVLTEVAITNNKALLLPGESLSIVGDGGGIANTGTLVISESDISHNIAEGWGGGIYTVGETLSVLNSTISSNTAYVSGGGIFGIGNTDIAGSTLFENRANSGGGIDAAGYNLTLTNCTLSGNHATEDGGAILAENSLTTIVYGTIYGNTASIGGGIAAPKVDTSTTPPTNGLNGSIVAGNSAKTNPDLMGTWITAFGNLVQNVNGASFYSDGAQGAPPITGISPKVGPLQNNGGHTKTLALLPGSPAIDRIGTVLIGSDTICGGNTAITTDQRGIARPQGQACDLGAYEYEDR